ncbi:hypothetical protein LTR10_007592 [Elasticomyces elasticus]|nr:hypothetical protein LTR10_007592 [Elasticomyces elasticus]KAK4970596.1 hypothetical protein LTR42_007571 [Elasticomyces elasticus]
MCPIDDHQFAVRVDLFNRTEATRVEKWKSYHSGIHGPNPFNAVCAAEQRLQHATNTLERVTRVRVADTGSEIQQKAELIAMVKELHKDVSIPICEPLLVVMLSALIIWTISCVLAFVIQTSAGLVFSETAVITRISAEVVAIFMVCIAGVFDSLA